jgi:hypothetical protein
MLYSRYSLLKQPEHSKLWDPMVSSVIFGRRCHWHRPPLVSGVFDTAHHRSAVPLTPPTTGHRFHWHRPPVVSDDEFFITSSFKLETLLYCIWRSTTTSTIWCGMPFTWKWNALPVIQYTMDVFTTSVCFLFFVFIACLPAPDVD